MDLNCGKLPSQPRPVTPPHLRTKERGWCFIDEYRPMPRPEPAKKLPTKY